MDPLDITIVGPGRAGMAVALAAHRAGHSVRAVVGRDAGATAAAAAAVGAASLPLASPLPGGDLLIVAVRDAAIASVAADLDPGSGYRGAVHLSGFTGVDALAALAERGVATGSLHPLQTLPTAESGAERLAGAFLAVTAADPLRGMLHAFAGSLGCHPFDLADEAKPLYHAAAAAAANFPLAAFAMARDLFAAAGVDFAVAEPLVSAVVANAFALGPRAALTGPVARGDLATVEGQLAAVAAAAPEWLPAFAGFVGELARLAGRSEVFEVLGGEPPRHEGR